MTRLLDLQFGYQPQHIDDPAEAVIAPSLGDDKILLDALAGSAGQQSAYLLQ